MLWVSDLSWYLLITWILFVFFLNLTLSLFSFGVKICWATANNSQFVNLVYQQRELPNVPPNWFGSLSPPPPTTTPPPPPHSHTWQRLYENYTSITVWRLLAIQNAIYATIQTHRGGGGISWNLSSLTICHSLTSTVTFLILIGYESLSFTVAMVIVSEWQIVSDDKFHDIALLLYNFSRPIVLPPPPIYKWG